MFLHSICKGTSLYLLQNSSFLQLHQNALAVYGVTMISVEFLIGYYAYFQCFIIYFNLGEDKLK